LLLRSSGPVAYSTVVLGSQPVWDPGGWPAVVATTPSLRAQLNRARNKHVQVEEWPAGVAHEHPELKRTLGEWLRTRGLPPLHFLVEPETLTLLDGRRIFVASRAGKVVGFLVASPIPLRAGWLTEQFVRGYGAPNGTVELMVDFAMRALAADGAKYVTMGLVPLSSQTGSEAQPNPFWLRIMLAWIRAHGRRFYNFKGLESFKAKLRPDYWEPIYAISTEERFSFRTLYAIAAAFTKTSPLISLLQGVWKAIRQELTWLLTRMRRKSL
jgi:phosphatidylglycerol lysyltransferase